MPISGLRGIHEIPLGLISVHFIDVPQDFLGMTASFVKAGLTADELCVWILPPPLTKRLALKELEQQGVNGSMLRDRKQLQIVTAHDLFSGHLHSGSFARSTGCLSIAGSPTRVCECPGCGRTRAICV